MYAKTMDLQYVKIKGSDRGTGEVPCDENFNVINKDVVCRFRSAVNVGEYQCVVLRTWGTDGLYLTQVRSIHL